VDHHQYADDTQLFLAIAASTIHSNLSTLEICSQAVIHWFANNDLLLNADESEVMLVGSSPQLKAASSINTVSVAGVSLPVSSVIKLLSVVINSRLTFDTHMSRQSYLQSVQLPHMGVASFTSLSTTSCCTGSIVGSRLDYCNSVLYGAPKSSIA